MCWLENDWGGFGNVGVTWFYSTCITLQLVTVSAEMSKSAQYMWMSDVHTLVLPATCHVIRFNVEIHSLGAQSLSEHLVDQGTASMLRVCV